MIELINERTARSKTFDLENGQKRVDTSTRGYIHLPNDFAAYNAGQPHGWDEVDSGFDQDPTTSELILRNHWMGLRVGWDRVGWLYQSKLKSTSNVSIELLQINDQPVGTPSPPVLIDGRPTWVDIVPGLDIFLEFAAGKVEAFKVLKTPTAPRKFLWQIIESDPGAINVQYDTQGHDNYDLSDVTRTPDLGPGRIKKKLVMLPPVLTTQGPKITRFTEEWGGEVVDMGPDRIPFISTDVSYPVLIDATVNENILADADDGYVRDDGTPAWYNQYGSTGNTMLFNNSTGPTPYCPGFLFTVASIASGDTIDSATLALEFGNGSGAPQPTAYVYGSDEDSATAWSDSHHPRNMTKTTAKVDILAWGNNFKNLTKNVDVKTIVQEIVNRAGWAAGNDMAFGIDFTPSGGSDFSYIGDYSSGGDVPATLSITYTAAAGANPKGVLGGLVLSGPTSGPLWSFALTFLIAGIL